MYKRFDGTSRILCRMTENKVPYLFGRRKQHDEFLEKSNKPSSGGADVLRKRAAGCFRDDA